VIDNPDLDAQRTNPGCGDVIRVMARLDPEGHIEAIRWEGQGCTISRASASIFTEMVEGKPLGDAVAVDHEQMIDLIGRDILMHRVTCATMALDALRDAAQNILRRWVSTRKRRQVNEPFEEKYFDVLQNIEFAIVQVYRVHPDFGLGCQQHAG
jgi:nitrogen fixation NifU-like protein